MRTGGRVSQGEAAQPVSATKVRRRRAARRRNDDGSAEILVDQAGAEELIAEDAVNGQSALRDGVGHGRKRRGELHRAHRVVVQQLHARGAPPLDKLELAALGDAELDGQLSADAAARRLVGVDPLALDPLANLIEVVLVARVRRVERNRLALDAASSALEAASASATEHARRRRLVGRCGGDARWALRTQERRGRARLGRRLRRLRRIGTGRRCRRRLGSGPRLLGLGHSGRRLGDFLRRIRSLRCGARRGSRCGWRRRGARCRRHGWRRWPRRRGARGRRRRVRPHGTRRIAEGRAFVGTARRDVHEERLAALADDALLMHAIQDQPETDPDVEEYGYGHRDDEIPVGPVLGQVAETPRPHPVHAAIDYRLLRNELPQRLRPTASATGLSSRMSCVNFDGLSDCGPSESASSGLGCTSMMSPSAPHATAPLAMGATRSQCPVPWDGSTTTGRWESFFNTGTALRSRVKRVDVSKVRIPRSHRMTSGVPAERMYSAERRNSWMLVAMPRLRRTGLPISPTRRRRVKFWMLRAPIWRMSLYWATSSTLSVSSTSVTTGRPVRLRASARYLSPCSLSPWKA